MIKKKVKETSSSETEVELIVEKSKNLDTSIRDVSHLFIEAFVLNKAFLKRFPLIKALAFIILYKLTMEVIERRVHFGLFSKIFNLFRRKYVVHQSLTWSFNEKLTKMVMSDKDFLTNNREIQRDGLDKFYFLLNVEYRLKNVLLKLVNFKNDDDESYSRFIIEGRDRQSVFEFLHAVDNVKLDKNHTIVVRKQRPTIDSPFFKEDFFENFKSSKTFDTLITKHRDEIKRLLDHFMKKTGNWHPYFQNKHQLNFLFYGPPGTGKTSLIKAIVNYTRKSVVLLDLSLKWNEHALRRIFSINSPSIFLFEDFDANVFGSIDVDENNDLNNQVAMTKYQLEHVREMEKKKNSSNMSILLNLLDGVVEIQDSIFIFTTNHVDRMDPALVRDGRLNKFLIDNYHFDQVVEYIEFRCRRSLTIEEKNLIDKNVVIAPCTLERMCQRENNNFEKIVKSLSDINQ